MPSGDARSQVVMTHNPSFTPYVPRPTRFIELVELAGWKVKLYGITLDPSIDTTQALSALKSVISSSLPQPARTPTRYGAAFAIFHTARDANYFLVDWWTDENVLQHRLYRAPLDAPHAYEDFSPSGAVACVWELRVIDFEREAWVTHVLSGGDNPDFASYFAARSSFDP